MRIPIDANVLQITGNDRCIIATTNIKDLNKAKILEKKGVEILQCDSVDDQVDLKNLMDKLGKMKIDSILLEGGGTLNYSALKAGIVDYALTFISPKFIGGKNAKTSIEGTGFANMKDAIKLDKPNVTFFDEDILVYGGIKCLQEEIGSIINPGNKLKIKCKKILLDVSLGDSIAVNGVCLTVTEFNTDSITVDVMNETLNKTYLGSMKKGDLVNLERAMSANGRFGGHIVSGHIDGTGIIREIKKDGISIWYSISADNKILNYIVEKGSIAIDGISLTVAYIDEEVFKVSVIPHTQENTTLLSKNIGDKVNLENDIIGKYIEKLYKPQKKESKITEEFLIKNGF